MCFSTHGRPGPSRTRTGASRPLRSTAPAHKTKRPEIALGSQVTRLRTRTHRCVLQKKIKNQTVSKHMCFSIESDPGQHGAQARAR